MYRVESWYGTSGLKVPSTGVPVPSGYLRSMYFFTSGTNIFVPLPQERVGPLPKEKGSSVVVKSSGTE